MNKEKGGAYIALLRGINVGGANKVPMAALKETFEALGFEDVQTFIASGNVIFSAAIKDRQALTHKIEAAIKKEFGAPIKVLVKSQEELHAIVQKIPSAWVNDEKTKCDVIFLWDEINTRSILKELPFNPEIEDIKYVEGAVLWRIDRAKAAKSRMFKLVGTPLYRNMTVRNPNTVRKIYQLLITRDKPSRARPG